MKKAALNIRPNSSQKILMTRSRRNKSVLVNKARAMNQNSPQIPDAKPQDEPAMVL